MHILLSTFECLSQRCRISRRLQGLRFSMATHCALLAIHCGSISIQKNRLGRLRACLICIAVRSRWLRPRDEMSVAACIPHCGPIRRQLLCAAPTGGMGFTSPQAYDTPLAEWLQQLHAATMGTDTFAGTIGLRGGALFSKRSASTRRRQLQPAL